MNTTELCASPVLGPEQNEEVGHVGDGDAAVSHHPLTGPTVDQVLAVRALDVEVGVPVDNVESGGEHDGIDVMLDAVDCDDAVPGHSGDPLGDQFGLRVRDGLIEVVRDEDSLAAGAVPRRQLGSQFRIRDVASHIQLVNQLGDLEQLPFAS